MNPDCRLVAGAMDSMRAALDAHPSCAIVGPRILDPDGTVQGSARGDPDMLTGLFGRTGPLRGLLPTLSVARRNVVTADARAGGDASVIVDWVSGACMLARRAAFASVRGFDERYFLYWEDADLCRRLRRNGYEVRYVPGAAAVHRVGHSSQTARAGIRPSLSRERVSLLHDPRRSGTLNPKRPLARVILSARCWWKLRNSKGQIAKCKLNVRCGGCVWFRILHFAF